MVGVSDLEATFPLGVDLTECDSVSLESFFDFVLVGVERVGFDLPLAAK